MKTTDSGREARSRNARRLNNLTIGTVLAATLATVGFGALGAATYTGTHTTTTASSTPAGTTATRNVGGSGAVSVSRSTGTGVATSGGS